METATDEGMHQYFVENGLSEGEAKHYLEHRHKALADYRYLVPHYGNKKGGINENL